MLLLCNDNFLYIPLLIVLLSFKILDFSSYSAAFAYFVCADSLWL